MISEECLRLAAQEAGRAIAASLPEPEDCQAEFSPSFERKMKKLIWRADHRGLCLGLKRAACFFLALLLSGGVFLTVNAEARELVFGWISQRAEDAQHYFFRGDVPTGNKSVHYYLSELPEEYSEWSVSNEINGWSSVYVNDAGEFLDFGYRRDTDKRASADLFFTVDGMTKKTVHVNGVPAEYYQDDTGVSANLLVWINQEADTLFYISAYLDEEQLLELAESVVPEE